MISDEERKRVTANLRQYLKKYETPDWRAFCNIILGSGRLDNLRKAQAFDHLADLIDRPTCHDEAGRGEQIVHVNRLLKCPHCGWDGQIWESVELDDMEDCDECHARFCPRCGRRVEND